MSFGQIHEEGQIATWRKKTVSSMVPSPRAGDSGAIVDGDCA